MLRTIFAPWLAVYDLAAELKAEQRAGKRLEDLVVDQAKQLNDARRRIATEGAQVNVWGVLLEQRNLEIANLKRMLEGARNAHLAGEEVIRELRAQLAKFDHDGDGKPGGGRKRVELTYSADGDANNAYNPPRRRAQS